MTQQNSETRYFFVVRNGSLKGMHEVVPDGLEGGELEKGIEAVEKHLRGKISGDAISDLIRTQNCLKDVFQNPKYNFDSYTHMCYSAKEHLNGNGKKDLKEP